MNTSESILTAGPANDNDDHPYLYADTALTELYRLRHLVLAQDCSSYTLHQWQERKIVLEAAEAAIAMCLNKL